MKKFFCLCHNQGNGFLFKVSAKLVPLKEATKEEDADILFLDLKTPGSIFEKNFEKLNGKPAIILSTQADYYNKQIEEHLKSRGIEKNKIIIQIPVFGRQCITNIMKEEMEKLLS